MLISIDQNSNSLWDTLPKLQALQAKNYSFIHLIEDIDSAFTRVNPQDKSQDIKITCERYYPNGNLDWGASLFYSKFLGRMPINPQILERYLGQSLKSMCKILGISIDDFYKKYGESDNFQVTAPSFLTENKDIHRVLGDIETSEISEVILELLNIARDDLLKVFSEPKPIAEITTFFKEQQKIVKEFCKNSTNLAEIYEKWLMTYLPKESIGFTSDFFAGKKLEILKKIMNNFESFQEIYNLSLSETKSELTPLKNFELPFFAIYETIINEKKHLVRSPIRFNEKKEILIADKIFSAEIPSVEFFKEIKCLSGKALLLVILTRLQNSLALPEMGSLYTPAANFLAKKMQEYNFLPKQIFPITRVNFNFLQQLKSQKVMLNLPKYLHELFQSPISTDKFAEIYQEKIHEANDILEKLENSSSEILKNWTQNISEEISILAVKKRNEKDAKKQSDIWQEIKKLEKNKLIFCLDRIVNFIHISNLNYWNSRGAILPNSLAIGGSEFYQEILRSATIYHE